MSNTRLRDLGINIGNMTPGSYNAITDVPGIRVGHSTLIYDQPRIARTGVTIIAPHEGHMWEESLFAGYYSLNGNGEMTGLLWLEESGLLTSMIGLTNTYAVGTVRDSLVAYEIAHGGGEQGLPVVAETYDGVLSDIGAFHVTAEHALAAIEDAKTGPVSEGNVGGGTGMVCHEFKGGIGTSSRLVETMVGQFVLGVLVQANYGKRPTLRINGFPVGRAITTTHIPGPMSRAAGAGSIIVVVATDAPLLPFQCKRLARRATIGLARAGGVAQNSSGDIFLAFSTANRVRSGTNALYRVNALPNELMDPLFEATAEAIEEAILNALVTAETMTGLGGRTAHAIPHDTLRSLITGTGSAL